jgi:Ca-activated chloride channel family protein
MALTPAARQALRVDVRLVNVAATVTDGNGEFVRNLTVDDFIVEEDGKPQEIVHFSQDHEVLMSVGILLDTSASMESKLKTATGAIDRFARIIHPDDDLFLMTFATKPTVRLDFTSDRQKLSGVLRSLLVISPELRIVEVLSAINDSMSAALEKLRTGRHDKRAILLITDGRDTWSRATAEDITNTIRSSEVLVYSLGIGSKDARNGVNMDVMRQFAETSGGRATLLPERQVRDRSSEFDEVFSGIADELRNQYTLGYYPSSPNDGRFHAIHVRTRNNDTVRARTGYH